jgi:transcriptional regulator with XRE-family HTH domain
VGPTSPTVARWELSLRIRERRHELGLDVKTITNELGFSRNYWSAVENDRTLLAADKLEAVCDLLQFPDTERAELRQLREESRERGWWMDYPALDTEELKEMKRFYGLEAGASHVRAFEGAFVTGLLQTEDYAQAIIASDPAVSPVQTEHLVTIRMKRQEMLRAERPLRLTTIMSEAVLHQEIGGRAVLARQLQYLLDVGEELAETVELRILPFATTPGSILGTSTLIIFDYASSRLETLVWQESIGPIGVIDEPNRRHQIELSYEQAMAKSLSRPESLSAIARRKAELDGGAP